VAGSRLAGRRGDPLPEPDRQSYRPVRAIGLLLILEVAVIGALAAFEFSRVDWRRVIAEQVAPSRDVIEALVMVMFVPAVALTLLSALGFLLLKRRGWLLGAISQGLVVATCLFLYAEYEPIYVYPIMTYAILMILYLNVHDVRAVFYPGDRKNHPQAPRRVS
jgi:hypothetical protein